ncbi:putative LRR receptor-like serine/threonine-protein kinase [Acorus calamus]|uniref:non-specific serine/threonine protein kinase n=1 Tax=Acorus calamus TaxID=4465 RepID=A0AAV9DV35_ACOCL|nr:putative LRR receptor-like serine/threonine-protein kinase [Acorus calamus]
MKKKRKKRRETSMEMLKPRTSYSPLHAFVSFLIICVSCFIGSSDAQARTDPSEARALNTMFQRLRISATTSWNISGEPCSGAAIDNTTNIDDPSLNPGIKCDCTFNKRKKCRVVRLRMSAMDVTGPIPDEIAMFTRLNFLRFEGNSLQGPIPSSFSNLTSLTALRISDLSGGSSFSLDLIKNMKSLRTLILRNNKMSGVLPPNMEEFKDLQLLDLSFNNLTGPIPPSLFNSSSLQFLFVGNNSLSGSLPSQKSPVLLNIDLSYNQLSGSLPSWVNTNGLQLNLVANNFAMDDSNSSVLPSGLNCLQRSIPCLTESPYYTFSINCGGKSITASDGTLFVDDTENLGAASYYVSDTKRWAVSNVGTYTSSQNDTYIVSSTHRFDNTLDSELFQTARHSPSSLRYYGLGLQTGNYTVSLQFAELLFEDQYWMRNETRVFDIYIQGILVEKDFDIRKEAGKSFKAVKKEYISSVSNNFLEIHFFWAGKGTTSILNQAVYGPLISAISVTPQDFNGTDSEEKTNKHLVVGFLVPIGVAALILIVMVIIWEHKERKLRMAEDKVQLRGTDATPTVSAVPS